MNKNIISDILRYCDLNTIINILLTNKNYGSLNTNYFWGLLVERDYEEKLGVEGKEEYVLCYKLDKIWAWNIESHWIPACNLLDLYISKSKSMIISKEITILTNLTELNIVGPKTEIPNEIVQLTNLTELNGSFNKFKLIPDDISKLINLRVLDMSCNQLEVINDAVYKLTNLNTLYLPYNCIKEISNEISKLTNLRVLDLEGNELVSLPREVYDLPKLID